MSEALGSAHITGPYRTLTQDISFGVDQLVEIAIRALSPAVNDTVTELTCIDWLGDSLCKVTADTSSPGQRRVLLDQAAMIQRASERSVPEAADREDVRRRYGAVLAAGSGRTADEPFTSPAPE